MVPERVSSSHASFSMATFIDVCNKRIPVFRLNEELANTLQRQLVVPSTLRKFAFQRPFSVSAGWLKVVSAWFAVFFGRVRLYLCGPIVLCVVPNIVKPRTFRCRQTCSQTPARETRKSLIRQDITRQPQRQIKAKKDLRNVQDTLFVQGYKLFEAMFPRTMHFYCESIDASGGHPQTT